MLTIAAAIMLIIYTTSAAMLDIGTMMMELAGLSFLGLGAQIPMAECHSKAPVVRTPKKGYFVLWKYSDSL